MKNRQLYVALLTLFITFLPHTAFSNSYPKTEADFSKLPPYCKARMQQQKSANYQLWAKRLGGDFIHVHHYCAGLHMLNKSWSTTNSKTREGILRGATGEISYTQKHSSPKFILQPEMSFKKGSILMLLNDLVAAHKEFRKGIQLNPKYSRNYSALSDLYKKQGNIEESRYILEQGLTHSPKSKALKRRLKKLATTTPDNPK